MAAMDGILSDLLLHGGRFEAIFGAQGVEMVADNAAGTKNFAAALRLPCGGRQDRKRRDFLGLTPCGIGLGRWGFQPPSPKIFGNRRSRPARGAIQRWDARRRMSMASGRSSRAFCTSSPWSERLPWSGRTLCSLVTSSGGKAERVRASISMLSAAMPSA